MILVFLFCFSSGCWIFFFSHCLLLPACLTSCLLGPFSVNYARTASADFSARLWDAVTGNEVHEFVHKHIVKSVSFAADRSKLATAGHEGILRIYDVASPSSPPTEVRCGWQCMWWVVVHVVVLLLLVRVLMPQNRCCCCSCCC